MSRGFILSIIVSLGLLGLLLMWWSSGGSQDTTTEQAQATPTGSGLIQLQRVVEVPRCTADGETWSQAVVLPTGYGLRWSWTVEAQYEENGLDPVAHERGTRVDGEAVYFCATEQQHVGKAMPLTWYLL